MNVAFRVDASTVIGLGHLKRCISLAKALRGMGSNCIFLCADLGFQSYALVESEGFSCTVLPALQKPGAARQVGRRTRGFRWRHWLHSSLTGW
jgi:UDP-2,4-diacetamido-2,4,6-trideoxy-beta-L-altropyranose hydrolase